MFVTFTLTALAVLTIISPAIMASFENQNVIKKQKKKQNNEKADENLKTSNVLKPPVNLAAMLPITKLTSSGYTEDERLQNIEDKIDEMLKRIEMIKKYKEQKKNRFIG
ncbi:8055_t:CDS:2 [Diversispora eburnea]|uniref:8055_t:CDS:1 n=1 Tax=Diversispora eburnea TaxID=1213867 RepID=A0A9N8UYT3_9GLOM|nr:8055_t:CDS:2 [Diversispora eburnea]